MTDTKTKALTDEEIHAAEAAVDQVVFRNGLEYSLTKRVFSELHARRIEENRVRTDGEVLRIAKNLHRAWESPSPWPWDVLTPGEQARWLRVAKFAIVMTR